MARSRIPLAERFWANVQKTDGCWLWTGEITNIGYGRFFIEIKNKHHIRSQAHRFMWRLTYGEIPDGMLVLHHCDNRRCVRPDHLFLGSQLDNEHDKVVKGRQAKGARHGRAKLTETDVYTIRARYTAGETSQRALARQYGVGNTTIRHILQCKNWQHIT